MKVILSQDISGLGRKYDIKEVNDGYARNFLFPRRMAEVATGKALTRVTLMKEAVRIEREIQGDLLKKNLSSLKDVLVTVKTKANEEGHLFSGIHERNIADALFTQHHITLSPEYIKLPEVLRTLGEFEILVSVKGQSEKFKLKIERENSK